MSELQRAGLELRADGIQFLPPVNSSLFPQMVLGSRAPPARCWDQNDQNEGAALRVLGHWAT